jgi:hypothetical protein
VTNEDNPDSVGSQPAPQPPSQGFQDSEGLQFDKAIYSQPVATKTCTGCNQSIVNEFYEASGQVVCTTCRNRLLGITPDKLAFWRALLFGGLAGVAGTIVWSLIIYLTGYELGLIAIVVGIGVGIAVRKGARGRSGWKYQVLAMGLTYVSITSSYVPMVWKGLVQGMKNQSASAAIQTQGSPGTPIPATVGEQGSASAQPKMEAGTPAKKSSVPAPIAILTILILVWGVALTAPFLAGASNIMGLIIIAIGLYEAWRFNRRVAVSGPFKLSDVPPAETAEPVTP